MKKLIKVLSVLMIVIILGISTTSKAVKIEVTKEKLEEAFKDLEESESNTGNNKYEITDELIKLSSDDYKYEMKYDLSNKPTFTIEALIKDGMNYDEFTEETSKLLFPMLAQIAVYNIQNVEYEDAMTYIMMYMFSTALGGETSSNSEYILYDDRDTSKNWVINAEEGQKVIKASEFDKYVMEYVNSVYKEEDILKDSNGINSFEWSTKKEDITDKSCKIVSTLTVDLDADFSKIKEIVDDIEVSGANNKTNNEISNEINNVEENTILNTNIIPNAGVEFGVKNILQIVIFVSILSIVLILITSKKEKC